MGDPNPVQLRAVRENGVLKRLVQIADSGGQIGSA
jgi:hypothetical protein